MRADVVEKRIYYITSRRSICVPLDGYRDVINHDEHDEYGETDIKRLACVAHRRQQSHRENFIETIFQYNC
jgi:hypothetical protein